MYEKYEHYEYTFYIAVITVGIRSVVDAIYTCMSDRTTANAVPLL